MPTSHEMNLADEYTARLPLPVDGEKPLAVFYNDSDYWVAHSEADASLLYFSEYGESDGECHDWQRFAMKAMLGINLDDGRGNLRMTVEDWIKDHGRGFLCSEDM